MGNVRIEQSGEVTVARLDNGVTNSVNPELVESLSAALRSIEKESSGMVLAGGEKFFCIGLALPELLTLNRSDMTDFWYRFNQVTLDLYTLPIPTACAMAGHAPAVGTIWACACDFRFAAEEKTTIGLNEIQLGIPTPFIADLLLRQIVGDQTANGLLFTGKLITSMQAGEINLVNYVYRKSDVEDQAIMKIHEMTAFSKAAYGAIKAARSTDIRKKYEQNHKEHHKLFIETWFGNHAQKLLNEALKHF